MKIPLSPEEYALGLSMMVADHVHLARWMMLRCPPVAKRAIVALAFGGDQSDVQWRALASYALHEVKLIEGERPLRPMEHQIRTIAERIYDASLAVGERLGIDMFPEDTDRPAARAELDRAFERAALSLLDLEGDPS
jgi:hypothetical protein